MLSKTTRMFLLLAEIQALKHCMLDRYEQSRSFRDPILLQLSEILDKKLNKFDRSRDR